MSSAAGMTILLVEDDDGHARLVTDLLRQAGAENPVIRLKDGVDAWDFLSGRGEQTLRPDGSYLMLLDIRMPGLDGIEVLRRVKSDARLRAMPVVMLTTTDDPAEIEHCYDLGCNAYLVKPLDFIRFADMIKAVAQLIKVLKTCRPGAAV